MEPGSLLEGLKGGAKHTATVAICVLLAPLLTADSIAGWLRVLIGVLGLIAILLVYVFPPDALLQPRPAKENPEERSEIQQKGSERHTGQELVRSQSEG